MNKDRQTTGKLENIRSFYNTVYHKAAKPCTEPSQHLRKLARKLKITNNHQVLDVACGVGEWLKACEELGAKTSGIDLSENAVMACKSTLSSGKFFATSAESLPFDDDSFDVVTCLGSLEHFLDPQKALQEMVRVAKSNATFLILVPNADFLTRRLGLFSGTKQVEAKEEVRTLPEWQQLFENSGLLVKTRWKDLHVLSWAWITSAGWLSTPLRAVQAILLLVWPLKWQYQVYHLCVSKDGAQ